MFDFLIKRRINSALAKNSRKHVFHKFKEINSVLILFDYDDWECVSSVIQDLESEGKKVVLWTIEPKYPSAIAGSRPKSSPLKLHLIACKELSRFKIIADSVVEEFKAMTCDTLIDFSSQTNIPLQYLLMNTCCEFCIGTRTSDNNPYDFILREQDGKSLLDIYKQIKFYLNNL